ncbi:DUF423 domain-containing protein [Phaeodactylibacter xiamenensis]|uniref:DUF423 domain-containing protein n=1 Tax=Phaeodactylibacter xiamenensis TaxID=1524460 RepID=UPI0024A82C38|nr:DUF423 domain-containing protein [Phaeodactylibacter xiamenensis]
MRKPFLRLGGLMALLAVALGAFGSHGLKNAVDAASVNTFEIGVRYQFYHAFALLAVGLLLYWRKNKLLTAAGWLFIAGIVLFSGSLYLLAISELFSLNTSVLGPVTPVGGVAFIAGWACFILATFQKNEKSYRRKGSEEG